MATKTAPRHPGTRPRRAAAATRADARANVRAATARRQRRRGYLLGGLALVVVVTIIGAMMYTARTTSSTATRTAPDFTLIDTDGSVSRDYGTLGKGMHPGLPGHSFVLIDKTGTQRWNGEYPSMYLSSADLLTQVRKHLG